MVENRIRVLIVDDTRTIRAMIRAMLEKSPNIEVVGEAGDPYEARELIRELNPDVITLDVVMPKMDGLSFLEKLMRLRPMPVVMVSTRTTEKSNEAIRALSLGAVDCVDLGSLQAGTSRIDLAETVLMAAASNPSHFGGKREPVAATQSEFAWNGKLVLIGSSTGGVDALTSVLAPFPADGPPTVIAQHMPAPFLESFCARLDRTIAPKVSLPIHGQQLEPGNVYLAPGGDVHASIARARPFRYEAPSDEGEQFVPSIEVLFSSGVAQGKRIVSVMLTGMGRDGAQAMLALREAGAHTIVQSAETCVVDGMPRAAREIGAAAEVVALNEIGNRILKSASLSKQAADL